MSWDGILQPSEVLDETLHIQRLYSLTIGVINMTKGAVHWGRHRDLKANSMGDIPLISQLAKGSIGLNRHFIVLGMLNVIQCAMEISVLQRLPLPMYGVEDLRREYKRLPPYKRTSRAYFTIRDPG